MYNQEKLAPWQIETMKGVTEPTLDVFGVYW